MAIEGAPSVGLSAAALRARRGELSNQLTSAQSRRNSLVKELQSSAEGVVRIGLEQRLSVLDNRIVQLEKDIAESGRQLVQSSVAGTEVAPSQPDFGSLSSEQLTGISIVFILVVMAPLAMILGRAIARRVAPPRQAPAALEDASRLHRMEQAIDAIAVEVERISENQRFVTQIMVSRAEEPAKLAEGQEGPDRSRMTGTD